jgi:hypothetical protein
MTLREGNSPLTHNSSSLNTCDINEMRRLLKLLWSRWHGDCAKWVMQYEVQQLIRDFGPQTVGLTGPLPSIDPERLKARAKKPQNQRGIRTKKTR